MEPGEDPMVDAAVAVLRASGLLQYETDGLDQSVVMHMLAAAWDARPQFEAVANPLPEPGPMVANQIPF